MTTIRCAGCRQLRRKCPSDCVLLPYFPCNNPQRFACVHSYYGASNVAKMLKDPRIPVDLRGEAADCLYWEAQCRIQNRVHGCVGIITALNQEIYNTTIQLQKAKADIAILRAHAQPNYHTLDYQIQAVPSFNYTFLPQHNGVRQSLHAPSSSPWF